MLALKSLFLSLALLSSSQLVSATPVSADLAERAPCDAVCKTKGVEAYIKALTTHTKETADLVPLTDDVVRFETFTFFKIVKLPAAQTAGSAKELRNSLQYGLSAFTSYGAKDKKFTNFNNGTMLIDYIVEVGLFDGKIPITGTRVNAYFDFKADKISKINLYAMTPA